MTRRPVTPVTTQRTGRHQLVDAAVAVAAAR